LTRPEDEVAKNNALKGLEVAKKYMCLFDNKNSTIVICNNVANELYKLRAQEKEKQKTFDE
jgi:hypothetical protein